MQPRVGIRSYPTAPAVVTFPLISITGLRSGATAVSFRITPTPDETYQLIDSLTWIKGKTYPEGRYRFQAKPPLLHYR